MFASTDVTLAREILIHGPIPRSELATRLKLSSATLTRLTKPLIENGTVIENSETQKGVVGRPSRPLEIDPNLGSFVGIKLTGNHLHAVVTDIRANVHMQHDEDILDTSPDGVTSQIVAVVQKFSLTDLRGIGISVGGYVKDNLIVSAPFLNWKNVDISRVLSARFSIPVTVENDLVALAEAENWFGVGRALNGFVVITIGAGVGYALVIDGKVVRTPDAEAGTGGHIPLSTVGVVCRDGHRGCSQAMLTEESIAHQVSIPLGKTVSFTDVIELAEAGNPAANTVVQAAGGALGKLIALAANLTLQSSVVLAGEATPLYGLVKDRVAEVLAHHRGAQAEQIAVHVDSSGFVSWARGAAAVSIQSALIGISDTAPMPK